MAADRLASGGEFNLSDPVDSFVEAVLGRVLHPSSLFSGLSRRGDFPSPLLFALVCHEVAAILGGLLALASGNQGGFRRVHHARARGRDGGSRSVRCVGQLSFLTRLVSE